MVKTIEEVRFDLNDEVEKNFNKYQDSMLKYPDQIAKIKIMYDHYLRSLVLHKKALKIREDHTIEFDVG